MNLLKKIMQLITEGLAQYEQFRVNDENEYQAMSCGAFNPRLLAKIKKSKANKRKHLHKR